MPLSWDEFLDWQAAHELDPWGELRADLRAAVPLAMVAAVLTADARPPDLTWPYFGEDEPAVAIDVERGLELLQQHRHAYGWT